MRPIRYIVAVVLILAAILNVTAVAWHFADPQNCREVLCLDTDAYKTKHALTQLAFATAGFVLSHAILQRARSSMHRKAKIYGGALFVIAGGGDLTMNIVAYAKGVYHSIVFTFLSPESAAKADILCDAVAVALGVYLLMTYRPAKRQPIYRLPEGR